MDQADTCDIAVSFLLDSGARRIAEHLKDFLDRGGRARVLVSDYIDVTEPIALRRLADLEGNLSLKAYETQSKGFHLKGTSNNVRGHKFGLGPIFDCLAGFFFRPLLRLEYCRRLHRLHAAASRSSVTKRRML